MEGMHLTKQIGDSFAPLVDLIYPPRCPLCGDALGAQGGLCLDCWGELSLPSEPSCTTCSRPLPENLGEAVCAECQFEPPMHSGITTATFYNEASRKLILLYKHGGKIALAPLLARLIAGRLIHPNDDAESRPLLIPVPLHPFRLWSRGFNQSALIARELAKLDKGDLLVDGLVRNKSTPSLGHLGKDERAGILQEAIGVRGSRKSRIAGKEIILVDDVLTTGATTNACTAALLEAGAQSVRIACFARVLDGDFES